MPTIVEQYFRDVRGILLAEFKRSGGIQHAGDKGTDRELFVENFLKSFFPSKYVIGRGQILDSTGAVSPQCDVIVYDETMPLLSHAGSKQYFAEGALAHIEIKSMLDRNGLAEDIEKCIRVGRMTLAINELMHFGPPRKEIPSFMVGYEGLKVQAFKTAVLELVDANKDAVFPVAIAVLDPGYICLRTDNGLAFLEAGEDVLAALFVHLNRAMWKNWSAVPEFTNYLGDGKIKPV